MLIKDITCHPEDNIKGATIFLGYEELCQLNNVLYFCSKIEKRGNTKEFYKIRRDIYYLFQLVKNGCLDSYTIETLKEIQKEIDKEVE